MLPPLLLLLRVTGWRAPQYVPPRGTSQAFLLSLFAAPPLSLPPSCQGIIVLPCGAGKTLVGITATTTIGRSCLVLCNSAVSVEQWYQQFLLWTTIPKDRIVRFTAATKEKPHPEACVVVSTYNMISFAGRRSKEAMEARADMPHH
eukprot:scaffold312656_cov32-Tisochrysis_lutea.AAC.3